MEKLAKKIVTAKKISKNKSASSAGRRIKKESSATTKKSSRNPDFSNHSVLLPTTVSKESLKRASDLRLELEKYIGDSVRLVSYVSAICFILVGATVSLVSLSAGDNKINHQSALLAEADPTASSKNTTLDRTVATETSALGSVSTTLSSEFEFLTDFPTNITEEFRVNFRVTNVNSVKVSLVSPQHKGFFDIESSTLLDNKYKTSFDPIKYPPAYYRLIVYSLPKDGSGAKAHSSREFFMGSTESEELFNDNYIEPEREEPIPNVSSPESAAPRDFKLINPNKSVLSGTVNLGVSIPNDYSFLELYARPTNSLSYRYVVLATKRFGNWVFQFDTNNLPNGEYEFVARTTHDGVRKDSLPLKLMVRNLNVKTDITSTSQTTDDRYEEPSYANFERTITLESDVEDKSLDLLTENSAEINNLLRKYASAIQTGDQALIDLAKKQMSDVKDDIVFQTLQDQSVRDLADDIDRDLDSKINTLQKRVERFEELRKERSHGETSTDSDGDGISDYDEINIYGTDPNLADTDNDGFNDGVEIIRGFNPLDDRPEAVVTFESPRDFRGLERAEILQIDAVVPVLPVDKSENIKTRAEISGRALPNSFVTLFIFSTPTVVTIKTDSDGSFVYTFDKELEDGEHEVYVAITDNTGGIIAQSKPFRFIKTAEAFTPVDAEEAGTIVTTTTEGYRDNSYQTVIGIAVLALGIILLMLGVGLRTKNREDNFIDANDKNVTVAKQN